MRIRIFLFLFCLFLSFLAAAQEINTDRPLLQHTWRAKWIAHPTASLTEYGVFHFRKGFELAQVPARFRVHVSADNRYRLFVNGVPVGQGPARGDLGHWYYETVDLAPHLRPGRNVLAAQVYNFGEHRPGGQISHKTSFILQPEEEPQPSLSTDESWKVTLNEGYTVIPVTPATVENYYRVLGFYTATPGDRVDGSRHPWGWEQPGFDDQAWPQARVVREDAVATGVGRGYAYGSTRFLVPRPVERQQEREERLATVSRSAGLRVPPAFLRGQAPVTVPANNRATVLLDASRMTIGYPELRVSRGRGSSIRVTYAEALFDEDFRKGNRNEISGKNIYGLYDIFLPDGGAERVFRPLWLRAFRFVQLDIHTGPEELVLQDFYNQFSAYPLAEKARFESSDPALARIWQAGWRTLQLCAQDYLYSDAYFEQMQYIGDARTQALANYYVTGDETLFRHALVQFDYSRVPEGLTQSRYPARELQIIPSYSLAWIAMVHDYLTIRHDLPFTRQFLPGIRSVLQWFEDRVDQNGLLTDLTWWYFPDRHPNPDGTYDDHSALATLQLVDALQKAAEIMGEYGQAHDQGRYLALAERLRQAVYRHCFDEGRQLFAESPRKTLYTQATNIMAVLTDALPADRQVALVEQILTDPSLTETTLYYKFYLFRAMQKTGHTARYFEQLAPWHTMLGQGMTAFGEVAQNPRSDCHPWSASPNIDFMTIVAGVQPTSFGSRTLLIRPTLGRLSQLRATVPHPAGEVLLDLRQQRAGRLRGTVTLPAGVTGRLEWQGRTLELTGGRQEVNW